MHVRVRERMYINFLVNTLNLSLPFKYNDLAGIYIHIPFCKQACHYCDFHFSTSRKYMDDMVDALCKELEMQRNYIQGEKINTLYFGGGTPSLLSQVQLEKIFETVRAFYQLTDRVEVTLEANPDDLNLDNLHIFKKTGINRLSIGVQSFHERVLRFLNRAHDQYQALQCFTDARTAGFENISIDLIYAIPADHHQNWHDDLHRALQLRPEHISSYCLTIEPKTAFGHWLRKGQIPPIDEEFAATQFEIMTERLTASGYEQYEVSNFCLPGWHSQHNSGYWKQETYLGIGPSAHSYDGENRQFNISHNAKYMAAIQQGIVPYKMDILNANDKINEYLLTTLRTEWGAHLPTLKGQMNYDLLEEHKNYVETLLKKKYADIHGEYLKLTRSGMLLADKIASDLFRVE